MNQKNIQNPPGTSKKAKKKKNATNQNNDEVDENGKIKLKRPQDKPTMGPNLDDEDPGKWITMENKLAEDPLDRIGQLFITSRQINRGQK